MRVLVCCALVGVSALPSCGGGNAEAGRAEEEGSAGRLTMRDRSRGPSGSLDPRLFKTHTPPMAEEPLVGSRPARAPERLIVEPRGQGRGVPTDDGVFDRARGFRIEGVPKNVRFLRVTVHPATWEIIDRRDRRIALIQEIPWRYAPTPAETAPFEQRRRLDRWGDRRWVHVRMERFGSETFLFNIERLAAKTRWIRRGWRSADEDNED